MLVEQRVEGRWFCHNLKALSDSGYQEQLRRELSPLVSYPEVGSGGSWSCILFCIYDLFTNMLFRTNDAGLNPLNVNLKSYMSLHYICVSKVEDPKLNRSIWWNWKEFPFPSFYTSFLGMSSNFSQEKPVVAIWYYSDIFAEWTTP